MQRRPLGILALGLILFLFSLPPPAFILSSAVAEPADADAAPPAIYPVGSEPQPEPSPVRWEDTTAILGSVRLDSVTKTVTATGWVNQTEGAIEVLACGTGGKVHESVFVLALNPLDLQAAFLLAGLKGGEPMSEIGQGPPNGAPVDILVEWKDGDETQTARAETFVWNIEDNVVLPETPWTFTGSVVKDGQFKALAEESLVVTYWDPYAIVNLPLPCGANDEILHVNTNTVPPYHTPVTFRFVPATRTPFAADFNGIQTALEAAVGGHWKIQRHDQWNFLSPDVLPPGLQQGTFSVFVSTTNQSSLSQAETWMETCQAPFFILGTNRDCVAVTYVPRKHPVSQALIKALQLAEPAEGSPAEKAGLRGEEK
ncbi:MAG TPA: hypothetical protein DCM68_05315 [Verrucomicrobia bacterium]|nr:hypothetical protein [Verrucomicrobiota bacterium]